uniref:Galactosyltransferase C-terminal domain-containing protein n=1 Tax=Periophthalmus magnuspinnatus TaxID=409849 RepID=A0A3B3ZWR6_9GOBI
DDNSELWLSTDNSPLNLLLRAWVGKTGAEWTAPGEYDKYINQKSVPIRFVVHKVDKSNTVSPVKPKCPVHCICSTDESPKLIGDIAHIPQTAASHEQRHGKKRSILPDMQREDPRDTLYRVPLVNLSLVSGLLPDCEYNPSYTLKGQRLGRYEGLNYVHLSYIYPNDHTRLTHLDEICYYSIKPPMVGSNLPKTTQTSTRTFKTILFYTYTLTIAYQPTVQNIYPSDFGDISPDQWDELGEPVVQSMPINENSNAADKWSQTFQVKRIDYQGQKSHALNMDCRVTGNIQAQQAEVQSVVGAYLDKITQRHGRWTLAHVANVVLNVDVQRGRRYLVELVVRDETGTLHRLSQYIYAQRTPDQDPESPKLCYPTGFNWNPQATVHFVIPVKNQAKWVHLLIKDMETLVKETGDANFNLILTDFNSSDMDVEQGLAKSQIPRYQYKKLTGNFERSRGLQEGIFENSLKIISSCRHQKYYRAKIPCPHLIMCSCAGYWEVQGFGLLGIYKSDLEKVGGMNTREFKDRWGGEDWELLDRVLMGGLEVERLYIRNLYHHFHSKRGMWVTSHH